MVGWDEILHPDLPKNSVVQSWRGVEYLGQTVRSGYSAILSAPWYLDHMDSAEQLYLADPLPAGLTAEQATRVLGGEACMWGEQISPETIDSRIWPRLAAIAERFWSPASLRDVNDMYRRLSAVSLELEGLGLGHEAHSYRMIRQITGERGVQALHDLLLYVQPITFGQRARIQQTTQLTPLTRLIDAARPDPWSRNQLNQLAAAAIQNPSGREAESLVKIFALWRALPERYSALRDQPLARDGDAAVATLARLGEIGKQALDNRAGGKVDSTWQKEANRFLDAAAQPQGMLRVVGVEAVRMLVR
jgi:hexosaminidase